MPTSTPNQRLKRERQLRGWSQGHLAKQIEVPDYYISRWERGDVTPSPYYQQRLCALFEKTAEELGFLLSEEPSSASSSQPADVESVSQSKLEVSSLQQHEESRMSGPLSPEPVAPLTPVVSPPLSTTKPLVPAERTSGTQPLLVPRQSRKWHRSVFLQLILVIILVVSGVLTGAFFLYRTLSNGVSDSFVGILSFSSSGVEQNTTSQGIADQVQVKLRLLQQPSAGKRYYTWLMPDQDNPEGNVVALGILTVQGTTGQLSYRDPRHTNLLGSHSKLLITEQDVSPIPQAPSLDHNKWRYQAQIPQIRASGTPYSLLDHVRHLVARDPYLEQHHLPGGLAIWLKRNSKQLVTWATDARSAWDNAHSDILRQDLIRLLGYLDGLDYIQQDLPGDASALQLIDQRAGRIGLIDIRPSQPTRSYLMHVNDHLRGIASSPGVSTEQITVAEHVLQNTDAINSWLQQARQDVLQLLKNFDQPPSASQMQHLLTNVYSLVTFASEGKPDSVTGNSQGGTQRVNAQILQLASMQIRPA